MFGDDDDQKKIQTAGEELGKSLAKILLSEKYRDYTYPELIQIVTLATIKTLEIIKEEMKKS